MKLYKALSCIAAILFSIAIIGCSNPSETISNPNSNATGESTSQADDNPASTETNSEASEEENSNSDNQEVTDDINEIDEPKYEWIYVGDETISNQCTDTYEMTSYSISEYTFSYYNSAYDYKYTALTQSTSSTTIGKGTEQKTTTSSESESKSIYTSSKNGDIIYSSWQSFAKNNDSWELRLEYTYENYKNTWLTQYSHRKQYAYTVTTNGVETQIPETESETTCTVELLSNSNGVEQYKVTDNSSPSDYTIYEFKNNIIHQIVKYFSTGSFSKQESIYTQPDNSIIQNELPTFALLSYKIYDSEDNIISEYQETVEDVTIDDTLGILKIKTGKTSNTESNYTYSISTYKKMQVPFSNE